MKVVRFILTIVLAGSNVHAASGPCVIPERSHFRIHVGTAGLFGAFAHDHQIEAQKIEGCAAIDAKDLAHSSIKLEFPAAGIHVMDPKESARGRAEVQNHMEMEVLRIAEYPRVSFESTAIERAGGDDQLKVHGNLTIRGNTQPAVIPLTFTPLADGTYRVVGKYSFKQTSFLIKPIQLAGGAVKVKDEIQTEFEIILK